MSVLFIPSEASAGEPRVAATPETVKRFVKDGFEVLVEQGAGVESACIDKEYIAAGAQLTSDATDAYGRADLTLKINPPTVRGDSNRHEAELLKEGSVLAGFLWPHANTDAVKMLAKRKITCFAMDQVPRITRAQKMDALSSQANIAGYKAVILGADHVRRLFPLLMTAAGTITPAKVVIMGAGVAGLQAIATAKRLGAVVYVSDVRPVVKEQVESLGGRFIDVPVEESMQDAGGYAKEQSADFLRKQQEIVRRHIVQADVVITTAQIPGKPSPRLIPADMVEEMKPGAVIVDLAVEGGGNCELSRADEVVRHGEVTIIAHRNVAGLVSFHASDVYAKNLLAVVQHLYKGAVLELDLEDEINAGSIVTHGGSILNPQVAEAATAAT